MSIAIICVAAVSAERLAASPAPLSLVFQELAGANPLIISAIAIFAALNTILAQMTLSARVMYGMARQGDLPEIFGRVNQRTATPLIATAINIALAACRTELKTLGCAARFPLLAARRTRLGSQETPWALCMAM